MTKETIKPENAGVGAYNIFVGNFVSTGIGAITTIVAARILNPSGLGLYTIAIIVPSYMMLVIRLGLGTAATRFAAKYAAEGSQEKAISFVYSLAVFELLLSIASVAIVIPISGFVSTVILSRPNLSFSIVFVASLSVIGQALYNILSSGFIGLGLYRRSALLQVIQSLSKSVVTIGLLIIGFSVIGAVTGYAFGSLMAGFSGFIILVFMKGRLFHFDFITNLKEALKYSNPIYFAHIANEAIGPVTNTVLAYFVSNSQLGGYSAALNLSVIISLCVYPIQSVLLPIFSRVGHDPKALSESYRLTVRLSTLFIIPVAFFVIVFSGQITIAILGSAYQFASVFLVLLAVTSLLSGGGVYVWGPALSGIGETRWYFIALLSGSIVNLASVALLVRYLGVNGSIIAGILGQIISLFIAQKAIKARLNGEKGLDFANVWRIYLSTGLAAGLIFPISFLIRSAVLIDVIGAVLFIVALIPIMAWARALKNSDILTLESSFSSIRFVNFGLQKAISYYRLFERRGTN